MAHHFFCGLGSFIGPIVVSFYLSDANDASSRELLCQENSTSMEQQHAVEGSGLEGPFMIVFMGHLLLSLGYVLIWCLPIKMPGNLT